MAPRLRVNQQAPAEPRLPAVERALDLLEMLAVSNNGLTLSEVGRKLGIPISSAHYLLYTLVARGYIQHNTDGHHFSLGPRAFGFANLSPEELELRKVCSPHTKRLSNESKMIVQVGVRRGGQAAIIDQCDTHGWSGGVWVGFQVYLHASALGKALIAYLSDVELDLIFRGHSLSRFTPNTICSLEALKAHLAEVRDKGYAVNAEEDNIGTKTVAAPIFNETGNVIAAICVTGSAPQIPEWLIPNLADKVICAAKEISRDLSPN